MNTIKRRDFLKATALGAEMLLAPHWLQAATDSKKKPNIIYIFTDQQSSSMMSCAGNKWLKTPAMDYIAKSGIRFTRAYTTNPVCVPARVGMMTGRFPSCLADGAGRPARENFGALRIATIPEEVENTTIASLLKQADYELVYGGKEHLPGPLRPTALGFKDICDDERDELAKAAAKFIGGEHEKPYFMVVSFINPHDICYLAIRDFADSEADKKLLERGAVECATLDEALKTPDGVSEEEFFEKHCPPLPGSFEVQQDEPRAVGSLINRRRFRRKARESYTERDWRRHRWAYCRLTEFVDRQVQKVLDAVRESGQEENTLIIFSSDHGDMDGAHRMEHKTCLYEEAANIPFMAMWKGHIAGGRVDDTHLISNGLDLLPTVCDYAGVRGVSDPRGRSLRPLFEGKKTAWRDTLGVESEIGRMVIDKDKYKYIKYDAEGIEEQLLDLNKDPHEITHFTNDTNYNGKLAELRKAFQSEWFSGH